MLKTWKSKFNDVYEYVKIWRDIHREEDELYDESSEMYKYHKIREAAFNEILIKMDNSRKGI